MGVIASVVLLVLFFVVLLLIVVIASVVLLVLFHRVRVALLVLLRHPLILLLGHGVQRLPLCGKSLHDQRNLRTIAFELCLDDLCAILASEEEVGRQIPLRLVRILLLLGLLPLLFRGPTRLRWHVRLHLLGVADLVLVGHILVLLLVCVRHRLPSLACSLPLRYP